MNDNLLGNENFQKFGNQMIGVFIHGSCWALYACLGLSAISLSFGLTLSILYGIRAGSFRSCVAYVACRYMKSIGLVREKSVGLYLFGPSFVLGFTYLFGSPKQIYKAQQKS